jgi:uncharacterized membrane protein (DUF106 family)
MMIEAVILIQGVLIGLFAFDMIQRANDRKKLQTAEKEMKETQAALAELHNNAIITLKELSEKVRDHDLTLKASTASNMAPRRF